MAGGTDMTRPALLLILLLLVPAIVLGSVPSKTRPGEQAILPDNEPDTSKAIRLDRWATEEEAKRFHSVKGMPRWKVLRTLGHPCNLGRQKDGTEVWWYAWGVQWCVYFKNGVCTSTWSNDGY
jgi:hypothetical protein